MSSLAAALVAVLFALPVLAGGPAHKANGEITKKKTSAPVTIDAQLEGGAGNVSVFFAAAGTDVEISVKGVDGLTVTSAPVPVSRAGFAKGETASFAVTYSPGQGRSHVVVTVSGRFDGAKRATVASYAIGRQSAGQQKRVGSIMQFERQRIKVMPGQ